MHTKEAITYALTVSNRAVMGVIDEMSDAATTFPTPNNGPHPLWVLGHLTFIEGSIPEMLFGEANPVAEWSKYFADGTEPLADARAYPPFAEVRAKYQELRERNLQILASLGDGDLDKPTMTQLKGREKEFATYGKSFLTLALHQAAHRGHVTDARRAAKVIA